MSKREVLLLRHGKSDWAAAYTGDHERPLAERGERAAGQIGRFLRRASIEPDLIISSTALRAKRTAELVSRAAGWKCDYRETRGLYGASVQSVRELLAGLDSAVERTLLVGHNPVWEELLSDLVGGGAFRLPTASIVRIKLLISGWEQALTAQGELSWMIRPKLLQNFDESPSG